MDRHRRFLSLCYRHTYSSVHERPVAALLVIGSRPITWGVNKQKSSPRQIMHWNPRRCIHAELDAISKAPFSLRQGATLYVVRRLKNQHLGMARPCPACLSMIRGTGIKRIVYSTGGYPGGPDCSWGPGATYCEYSIIDL